MTARSRDAKTPLARFSFTQNLFDPRKSDDGKEKYGCTLLFTKTTDISSLHAIALEAAKEEWGDKAEGWIKSGLIKSPFLDGDGTQGINKKSGERHAGYEGCTFIRVQSGIKNPPRIVSKNPSIPMTSAQEFYSGCYGYAVVNAFTWENEKNGKGISFGISLAQFAKDGEKLGGGGPGNPEDFFENLADEPAAPASTKGGAGAGGLFG
jgi:hypothetical protein